jgi:hypothetical protein
MHILRPPGGRFVADQLIPAEVGHRRGTVTALDTAAPSGVEVHAIDRSDQVDPVGRVTELNDPPWRGEIVGLQAE